MKRPVPVATAVVNDTKLAQEPANPFSGSSLVPMLIIGIVLVLVGMIAAVMLS
jgi:flagellar basal body-associated protein FliL